MPTGIRILEWIVLHIRIPVQALRVARVGHERIRADKPTTPLRLEPLGRPSQRGIVVPRVVVIQVQARLEALGGLPNGVSRRLRRGYSDSRTV